MSWQQNFIIGSLKIFVKPYISLMGLSEKRLKRSKKILDRLSSFLPIPSFIDIDQVLVDGVPGEMITYTGDGFDESKICLYMHGGGYITCSPKTHRNITCTIAKRTSSQVLAIDYRKTPANPFPSALEDAITAYRWLLDKGFSPEKITFAGDSAGGHLVLSTLMKLKEEKLKMPGKAACLSPWVDLTNSGKTFLSNKKADPMLPASKMDPIAKLIYKNINDFKNPLLYPMVGNFKDFPELLVFVGSTEILLDDSRRLVEKAKEQGVRVMYKEWERAPHVFELFSKFVPESKVALFEVCDFLN